MGLRDFFRTGEDYFDIMRSMKFERLGLRGLRMHGLAFHHVDLGAAIDDSRWQSDFHIALAHAELRKLIKEARKSAYSP